MHTGVMFDDRGRRICGAKTRQGTPCRIKTLGRGGRCKYHGGDNLPPGPNHPRWKTGRASILRSKLPEHMKAAFDASLNDPDFISMRAEMGLLDGRIVELAEMMLKSSSPDKEAEALSHLEVVINELRTSDPDHHIIEDRVSLVKQLLNDKTVTARQWGELKDTMESRRRLADTERKLVEFKKTNMDVLELRTILTLILHALRTHVTPLEGGAKAMDKVVNEIGRLIPNPPEINA